MRDDTLKQIPPLMPQFLRKRRVGLPGPRETIERLGVSREAFWTLRVLHELQGSYGGAPFTMAQIRARDPYSAIDRYSGPIAELVEKGLLLSDDEWLYSLSEQAREIVEKLHEAGRAYVASREPLPVDELEEVAEQLDRAVQETLDDSVLAPRPGSHLAGSRSLAVFGEDAPAMVRIEQAILDLWMARDDAHMKAWREAGMDGPPLAVLTALWRGDAHNVEELQKAMGHDQTPADLESSLAYLLEGDFVAWDTVTGNLALTPSGALVREDIERETDRIYFTPWPHTEAEAEWLHDRLQALIDNL